MSPFQHSIVMEATWAIIDYYVEFGIDINAEA
jgi:hypothetical protein